MTVACLLADDECD